MKAIVFAYHDMGCVGIEALIDAGYQITAIYTHLDNPGENHFFGSVAHLAAEHNIEVFSPENVNHPLWIERIKQSSPDIIFSFYYRDLICDEILSIPAQGAFNLHGSLLPRYRGRAPLNWVLVNGETETGVTLHKMVHRADAGDIAAQYKVTIDPTDDALRLHKKLTLTAQELLTEQLPLIKKGQVQLTPQDESKATYVGRRTPEDGRLDWNHSATELHNLVRAVSEPWPGAFSLSGTTRFIVWKSRIRQDLPSAVPGKVLATAPLIIATAEGALEVVTGQTENSVYMQGSELAKTLGLVEGAVLSNQPATRDKKRTRVLILGKADLPFVFWESMTIAVNKPTPLTSEMIPLDFSAI